MAEIFFYELMLSRGHLFSAQVYSYNTTETNWPAVYLPSRFLEVVRSAPPRGCLRVEVFSSATSRPRNAFSVEKKGAQWDRTRDSEETKR